MIRCRLAAPPGLLALPLGAPAAGAWLLRSLQPPLARAGNQPAAAPVLAVRSLRLGEGGEGAAGG